jgi:hypothetical protein
MHLPKSWNEITVENFIYLVTLDEKDFDSVFEMHVETLSILSNESLESFYDLELEELNNLLTRVKWLRSEPKVKINQKIGDYSFKPFENITLGEFIDADYFTVQDKIKNIPTICAIFYRQTRLDDWGNRVFEPYNYNLNERSEVFYDIPITAVYGIVTDYLKFRDNFMKKYENLFVEPQNEDEENDIDLTPEEKRELQEEKKRSKWAWERLIYTLANEDITKVDEITDLPLTFVFNMLSMRHALN